MPKINQEEYEILQFLNNTKDWIVRNPDGQLWAVEGEAPWKAPFYETWKENDGQDTTKVDVNSFLFQFIQWEDSEPYNIAELIEEYEREELRIITVKPHSFDVSILEYGTRFSESEETEVKKDLKEAILGIEVTQFDGQKADLEELVNPKQLENVISDWMPEVLSQEWINDNNEMFLINDTSLNAVQDYKLRNLLVPKQEEITEEQAWEVIHGKYGDEVLQNNIDYVESQGYQVAKKPTVPPFVDEYIKKQKEMGYTLQQTFYIAHEGYEEFDSYKAEDWLGDNQELFARAWLGGYEVESEPRYFAKAKGHELMTPKHQFVYWNQKINDGTLRISTLGHREVYKNKMTLQEWDDLGINGGNADFVKVEELEE